MVEHSSHIRDLSDNELVERFKTEGNSLYVGELFRRYRHLVFGVCMKYLGDEDESQDVQMHIFEKLLNDLGRHEIAQFKGWLYMVSKNECLMYLRSRKSKMARDKEMKKDAADLMETDSGMHPDGVTEKEFKLRQMESAIEQLTDKQRICVEMFYLQQKCYKEIADKTGFSQNEVKSYIQNGKRNLKIIMEKQHER